MRTHRIVIGLVALALVVTACGDDDASTTTVAPTTTAAASTTAAPPDTATPVDETPTSEASDEWDPEFIVSFITGCTTEASPEQCECMLAEFQDRYAFDDFLAWAFEAAEDDPRIIEVTELCAR